MNARLWAVALLTAALAAGPAVAQTNRDGSGGSMSREQTSQERQQTDTEVNSSRSSGGVNRDEEAPSDQSVQTRESVQTKESSQTTGQGKAKKRHHKQHRTVKEKKTETTSPDQGTRSDKDDINRGETPSDVNEGGSVR